MKLADVYDHVIQMHELEKVNEDMYMMGLLDTLEQDIRQVRCQVKEVQLYCFGLICVCRKAIYLCCDLGKKQLFNIQKHMNTNGIKPRRHGNVNKKPRHALTMEKTKPVVTKLVN